MTPGEETPRLLLTRQAHQNLLFATTEVFPKETDGILIGLMQPDGSYLVDNAHAFQTSKRKIAMVQTKYSDVRDAYALLHAMNGHPATPHILGGFHSHPNHDGIKYKITPSGCDRRGIRKKLLPRQKHLSHWTEIIVRMAEQRFEEPKDERIYTWANNKRLVTMVRPKPYTGTKFTIAAYTVYPEKDRPYRELKVELLPPGLERLANA